MIYKFKSKAAGDVIMLGPTGDRILGAIGKEPAAKGIIEVADMPAAMKAVEAAIAADEAEARRIDEEARANGQTPPPRGITLRQRAWPLVEMMKLAERDGHDIVWGV
ncbi:DUF1840 domain-containing protein [Methylibium rhizosphaerae]|uniref:DUF1840 domain-containing protein n=1 Tax=Methylibium rhizosphaerae TaxID=2570323 RepID=UPI00112D4477|nr:DUF1840 domain-containing protein [Methylibium rhizosphaerae]